MGRTTRIRLGAGAADTQALESNLIPVVHTRSPNPHISVAVFHLGNAPDSMEYTTEVAAVFQSTMYSDQDKYNTSPSSYISNTHTLLAYHSTSRSTHAFL